MTLSDQELLQRFIRDQSHDAFAELVRRHLNLVYSVALRLVRSSQLAEEIAQAVFADLARDAARLKPNTTLVAWLHAVTRRTAVDVIRKESRRQLREQLAIEMNALNAPDAQWTEIEPLLDEAVAALDETDRAAVLLRYFENQSLRAIGQELGVSDDAAQKRVSRAVERLREFFAKRGVTVGASGLVIVISAHAVQAAPVGLVATISAAALAGTAATASTLIAAATKTIAMTTLQKTLVTATVAVLAGAGLYETRQATQLRDQVQTLQQQQAPLAEQVQQLHNEKEDLAVRLSNVADELSKRAGNSNELLKLRGEVTRLRADSKELARAKATLSALSEQQSEALKNMRESIRGDFTKQAEQQVKALQKKLSLTPEQTTALKSILNSTIQPCTQWAVELRMGEWTQEKQNQMNELATEQTSQVLALLSPQQKDDFWQWQNELQEADARRGAKDHSQVNSLKSELNISAEKAEAVLVALGKANMVTDESGVMHTLPPEYLGPNTTTEALQQRVEKQVGVLTSVLTPEQIELYRESELRKLLATRDQLAHEKAVMQLLKSGGK